MYLSLLNRIWKTPSVIRLNKKFYVYIAGCTHKGKKYLHGDTFKDDCNSCSCSLGLVSCTEKACVGTFNLNTVFYISIKQASF